MKRKKACAALLCAAMTVSGFPLGGGIVSAQENAKQETEFDIYVSPQGSDTEGDGSESAPYATIDRAREAARELTADGGSATVSVGEGKYFLEEPVTFGPEDSHVTYVGDNAVLTGAKTLEDLEWENYEGEIRVASVGAGLGIDQLFIGGEQQTDIRITMQTRCSRGVRARLISRREARDGKIRQEDISVPCIQISGAGILTGSQGKTILRWGFPMSGSATITEVPACSPARSWWKISLRSWTLRENGTMTMRRAGYMYGRRKAWI